MAYFHFLLEVEVILSTEQLTVLEDSCFVSFQLLIDSTWPSQGFLPRADSPNLVFFITGGLLGPRFLFEGSRSVNCVVRYFNFRFCLKDSVV